MSDNANKDGSSAEADKPAPESDEVKFPPFPEPSDKDFEDDVPEDERNYFKNKFPDLNTIKLMRLHCTACDRHLGSSARNVGRMRAHPMLRTLVCHTCHTFYNSGEFEKGDDGSELYCRWCGQGGQVYCCSDCPHVFCAKCIKRNMGVSKIKEIENADDWKCFKCCPESLKDLRAICWGLLRYCNIKNDVTYKTEDTKLREIFQKECSEDNSECCKSRIRKREKEKLEEQKKKEEKMDIEKTTETIISKMPSTIQVKKFASINIEDQNMTNTPKIEKKSTKRAASPKPKAILIKNPMSLAVAPRLLSPAIYPPPMKKIKISNNVITTAVRFPTDGRFTASFARIRPRAIVPTTPPTTVLNNFNGFNNTRVYSTAQSMVVNDNINLSLESLTHGLDMATVAALSTNNTTQNDDVICTPDLPIEPLCEVAEDNDDDVQCITPNPINVLKLKNPPPLVTRGQPLPDITSDNIIQMTDNDVTVNLSTGGLKFRVDPQTLSSNKMYRLPDGRVFAINANPTMPGGYSATIVAVTEPAGKTVGPQGATYAAKLSAVPNPNASTPLNQKSQRATRSSSNKRSSTAKSKTSQRNSSSRECDLNVSVEWFRYNLIDAVDAIEFSLSRLNKLKKETTAMFLRTRTVAEMKTLHRSLDRLLNTSSKRFIEIKDSLSKEMKQYVIKKSGKIVSDDDDDDVEILPDLDNEDPIFIDENSVESNQIEPSNQEIDLTEINSSELNDSGDKETSISRIESIPLSNPEQLNASNFLHAALLNEPATIVQQNNADENSDIREETFDKANDSNFNEHTGMLDTSKALICNESLDNCCTDSMDHLHKDDKHNDSKEQEYDEDDNANSHSKVQDTVMTDELIEDLLRDDSDIENTTKHNSPDVTELQDT